MTPKQKPDEKPEWFNFTIAPSEKARWKSYARKKGIPLATFVKMEINKLVDMEFETPLKNLFEFNPDFLGIIIFHDKIQYLYRYGEIEDEEQFIEISKNWHRFRKSPHFHYLDEVLIPIQSFDDRLILKSNSKSNNGAITILGYRMQNNIQFFARIKADGNALVALADLQRLVFKMFPIQPSYMEKGTLQKSLPDFYQEKSQLQAIELLRRIPLVPEEQKALSQLEQIIGKPIPVILPFENGDVNNPNVKFNSSIFMYFGVDGHILNLRLDKCNLKEIPQVISAFTHLQYLSLNNNEILKIPDFLADLPTLKVIDIENNKVTSLSESIWNIQCLEEMRISGNPITEITRINPEVDVPPVRLTMLKNFIEGNLIDFLDHIEKFRDERNYSPKIINLEIVAILKEFLKRIQQEFPETVLHTFVFRCLSGF